MLNRLTIRNIALIDSAEIEFGTGLNVLSGETGSGKSVLLDSINFALGAKADKSMIRYGETECSVSASFLLRENSPVFRELNAMDIEGDEELIITRRFRTDGRGEIKVNGCSVNAAMLKKITAHLVDVHGQSEHFYLLNESNQLRVIDRFAGSVADEIKMEISVLLDELRATKKKLIVLGGDEKERDRKIDILNFQFEEIARAELTENEEEILLAKKSVLDNLEKIGRALAAVKDALNGEIGAVDCLHAARRAMAEISPFDREYIDLSDRLENVCAETEDIADTVTAGIDALYYYENEAESLEKRLDLIKSLKKKYGNTIAEILNYGRTIEEELHTLKNSAEEIGQLETLLQNCNSRLYQLCCKLTSVRKQTAEVFCNRVAEELKTLNIKNAQFCAEFDSYDEIDVNRVTLNGLDSMRFLFSANKGELQKPLNKVISGGEMSRLMLAIKTRTSDINEIDTYIFDEIDTGISGNTAKVVSEKFASISRQKQIIAVSHLAQISAMADTNFIIFKQETKEGKTVTRIQRLTEEQKINEIVRLVGGEPNSDAAVLLANKLIKNCNRYKN